MEGSTRFVSRAAVEVWDGQFRWRQGRSIRDRTVDDTWHRVAHAIAAAEGDAASLWAQRFVDCLRCWRVLPDVDVLRYAGTGRVLPDRDVCNATVNVLPFVHCAADGRSAFDASAFRASCGLALRIAEDQALHWPDTAMRPEPRVGLLGVGDALRALDLHGSIDTAEVFCEELARLLALGCLRANLQLGVERGAAMSRDPRPRPRSTAPGPAWMQATWDLLAHRTLRRTIVTHLQPQPELSILANGSRRVESLGSEADPDAGEADGFHGRLCRAMQPWIDDPIDCGFVA